MKRILFLAALLGLTSLLAAAPSARPAAAKLPGLEALWVHWTFDGNIEPAYLAEGVHASMSFSRRSEAFDSQGQTAAPMTPVFEAAPHGKAIYFGPAAVNLLSRGQSGLESDLAGITAINGARLATGDAAWQGKHSLSAQAGGDAQGFAINGIATGQSAKAPPPADKPQATEYIFSLYAQGKGRIQLGIGNDASQQPEQTVVAELTPQWKRYACGFTAALPAEKIKVYCRSVQAANWSADGLMVESRPAVNRERGECIDDAHPWIAGDASREEEYQRYHVGYNAEEARSDHGYKATGRDSDFLTATFNRPIPWEEGSISFWFRPDHDRSGFLWEAGWITLGLYSSASGLSLYAGQEEPGKQYINAAVKFGAPELDAETPWGGQWHHLVSTWDAAGHARQYLDGELVAAADAPARPKKDIYSISIGGTIARQLQDERAAGGAIRDFAIFRKALSLEEAQGLRQAGMQGGKTADRLDGMRLLLPRTAYRRGETAEVQIIAPIGCESVALSLEPSSGKRIALARLTPKGRRATHELDTGLLRPGAYRLFAETAGPRYAAGSGEASKAAAQPVEIVVQPSEPPLCNLGFWMGQEVSDEQRTRERLARLAGMGADHYLRNGGQPGWVMDAAYRLGMRAISIMDTGFGPALALPPGYRNSKDGSSNTAHQDEIWQILRSATEKKYGVLSSFNPLVREAMRNKISRYCQSVRDYPGFQFLATDDEYGLRGSGALKPDYNADAIVYYQKTTGRKDVPLFESKPPGTVIPDDESYLKWLAVIGREGFTGPGMRLHYEDLQKTAKTIKPDLHVITTTGAELGELDWVMGMTYTSIIYKESFFRPATQIGKVEAYLQHREASQTVSPKKPQWPLLGWWDDNPNLPKIVPAEFRQNMMVTLANGVKDMTFCTDRMFDTPLDKPLEDEARRCFSWTRQYGPAIGKLKRPRAPVAYLCSEINQAYGSTLNGHGFYSFGAFRLAGAPMDSISDEQLLAGELKNYQALFLWAFDYATAAEVAAIEKFAAQGGKVFVDQRGEKEQSALVPKGATVLEFHLAAKPERTEMVGGENIVQGMATMVQHEVLPKLRDLPMSWDNRWVACYRLDGGEANYFFAINTSYEQAQTVNLALRGVGGNAYDVLSGKSVPLKKQADAFALTVSIPPSDWRVFAFTPRPIGSVKAELQAEGADYLCRATVMGADGNPLRAVLPVNFTVLDPQGKPAPYGLDVATEAGVAVHRFRPAKLTDPAGEWKVVAKELISGKQGEATVSITP
ncbi:MAG: hypothetical protein HY360_24880 [Verrucomicrobia bacterium]|nr:hypothetical protein [Verrucomicrobiota bacterium]